MPRVNYKPLLFNTTVRNPERIKAFLAVLAEHDGRTLTNALIDKVAIALIRKGLYRPLDVDVSTKIKWNNDIELDESEAKEVFAANPQDHNESGFDAGWPSRFDTWYKLAKELGMVWYSMGEKVELSETAKLLLDKDNPQNEVIVFANAFSKYYRNNPFRSVLNTGNPLVLLIKTIQLLSSDDPKSAGITRSELPILLCWHDDNATSLYRTIKKIRQQHGFTPSSEVILDICHPLLDDTRRSDSSILVDYPDEFIRKMRLTGLITLRGGGRFIDINQKEAKAIKHLLSHYDASLTHADKREFYDYISQLDDGFVAQLSIVEAPTVSTDEDLVKWADHYSWEVLSGEMLALAQPRGASSHDEILKIIDQPLRLEFLTAISIRKQLPNVRVKANYITDDEGLPTSFAPGGKPDIECRDNDDEVLVEVTLLRGTQQHVRESLAVQRHLEEAKTTGAVSYSILMTPAAFIDTVRYAEFNRHQYNIDVRVVDIDKFIHGLGDGLNLQDISSRYQATSF